MFTVPTNIPSNESFSVYEIVDVAREVDVVKRRFWILAIAQDGHSKLLLRQSVEYAGKSFVKAVAVGSVWDDRKNVVKTRGRHARTSENALLHIGWIAPKITAFGKLRKGN